MKYYIVFLDFDQDILDILEFTDEEQFKAAEGKARMENTALEYGPGGRDWFSFETFWKKQ